MSDLSKKDKVHCLYCISGLYENNIITSGERNLLASKLQFGQHDNYNDLFCAANRLFDQSGHKLAKELIDTLSLN